MKLSHNLPNQMPEGVDPRLFQLSSYDYHLPQELIAQEPLSKRDESRMLVLKNHQAPVHQKITDILDYLQPEDCLVINKTRVIPARIFGHLPGQSSQIECLLVRRLSEKSWRCLAKPGRKLKLGSKIIFRENYLEAEVIDIEDDGSRILEFSYEGIWEACLAELGQLPLPPYIEQKLKDPERYQTVYAEKDGSVAAPTAGLHFTEDLLKKIRDKGVAIAGLYLNVGIGTFRPIKDENILEHDMHSEVYELSEESADMINSRKQAGGRIICVGTTSCRTLESVADPESGLVKAETGETRLFIYPGYKFKVMDALLTNFHLPKSSLLLLVSAFYGREAILSAYAEAIKERYRFYSLGDCMLILGDEHV